jgi:hypothetical protein
VFHPWLLTYVRSNEVPQPGVSIYLDDLDLDEMPDEEFDAIP